jgi:hypothetical protein
VTGSCKYGDELLGSGAKELASQSVIQSVGPSVRQSVSWLVRPVFGFVK